MVPDALRAAARRHVPEPARRSVHRSLAFVRRVGRWPSILWQVRGVTWADQRALARSAFAAPLHALRDTLTWQDPVLLDDARVDVRGIGRFHVRAHSDDLWHVLPSREAAIFATLRAYLRQGDVFIDAGANIGIYTVLASKLVGATGKVFSVEMMPDTADQLENHISMNALENVAIVRAALSDVGGTIVTARVSKGKYGQARIAKADGGPQSPDDLSQVEVPTLTLDDLPVPPERRVRMIKIDLEGAEVAALRGADALLDRTDFVVFESWSSVTPPGGPVAEYLASRGFRCARLDGNNWLALRD